MSAQSGFRCGWYCIEPMNRLIVFLLAFVVVLLGGCADTKEGKRYLEDLGNLIQQAERIEVVEHSSAFDFANAKTGELRPAKERIYKRIVLTQPQKAGFQSAMGSLDPETQSAFLACIPVSHHRIEFFASGKLIDSMEVCFECGQVEWRGSSATPPSSLYGGLESLVVSVGMHPQRDWKALAAGVAR